MLFNSLTYILSLPLFLAIYYAVPHGWRNALLLVASLAFYMLWWPAGIVVMGWVAVTSYYAVQRLGQAQNRNRRELWMWIVTILAPLLFFKYLQPINECLTEALHIDWFLNHHRWAIPVGLSFYSLQALSYVADVYQGRAIAQKSWLNHALFVCFFPTVVSGPISRSKHLLAQIESRPATVNARLMVKGIKWMLWGLFLKLVLADCYFLFVHAVDGSWQRHNGFTLFVSSLCYMVQLYGDFAGYSLMAIGSAALMGIELPQNFMRPFFSVGVRDFWRRWHISLSTWLRDYIYFPLGGSRCTEWRTRLNLLITFMVSGLWHGAGWIFVLWGMLHGLWVALERAIHFRDYSEKTWVKVVVMPITFVIAALLFVTFNHDWGTTMYFYQAIFTDLWPMKLSMTLSTTLQARLLSMAAALAIVLMKEAQEEWWPHVFAGKKWGTAASASFYVAVVWMILAMGVLDSGSQFIYMHF